MSNKFCELSIILFHRQLFRSNAKSKHFVKTPRIVKPIRTMMRNFYVIHFVKTDEMVYGTKFLRNSYQNIVREDLRDDLLKLNQNDVSIIIGMQDKQINPKLLYNSLNESLKNNIYIIEQGGHNIAVTHTNKVISMVDEIMDNSPVL